MARPQNIQFLKHGRMLCKAVFPLFAETWNWVARSWDNLRGDFDTNPRAGYIHLDRTNADHPVIRLRTDRLSDLVNKVANPGCYELTLGEGDSYSVGTLTNQYYRVAGKTYTTSFEDITISDGILCLEIDATGSQPDATLETYSTMSALQSAEQDMDKFVCPLYTIAAHKIVCDWRKGAMITMTEF